MLAVTRSVRPSWGMGNSRRSISSRSLLAASLVAADLLLQCLLKVTIVVRGSEAIDECQPLDLFEVMRGLDGHHRLRRKDLQRLDAVQLRKLTVARILDGEVAHQLLAAHQW